MQCHFCGKEVSPEASYCTWCGANLRVDKDVILLREKIAEYRHKEIIVTITGLMGLLMQWLFLFRFFWIGFLLFLVSTAAGFYFQHERKKLMKQLES